MLHIIVTFKIVNTPAVLQLLQHHKMSQLQAEKKQSLTKHKVNLLKNKVGSKLHM